MYYIICASPIEMIYLRNMEYNKMWSMKSGVHSNFYFQWYFLNLVLKGSLNFYHIQNYFHFYVTYGSRYVKFNYKSIKFPKLYKVPSEEAININKPWSEWKERLRNFGVKQPKRGIELGWVTRGTRPKKPSSSRSFAREACGARGSWGSWGLKTENRTFFSAGNY